MESVVPYRHPTFTDFMTQNNFTGDHYFHPSKIAMKEKAAKFFVSSKEELDENNKLLQIEKEKRHPDMIDGYRADRFTQNRGFVKLSKKVLQPVFIDGLDQRNVFYIDPFNCVQDKYHGRFYDEIYNQIYFRDELAKYFKPIFPKSKVFSNANKELERLRVQKVLPGLKPSKIVPEYV